MQITYDPCDNNLQAGSEVELLLLDELVDRAMVTVVGRDAITLLTSKHQKKMTFIWDAEASVWKRPFRDSENRVCIRKHGPGYTIRPVPVAV